MTTYKFSSTLNQSSVLAAILYSIVATAGLFYVNLGGAFLSAFVDGLGVERDVAGYIVSANKYGAAFGALIATFIVKRVEWRKVIRLLFMALIAFDLISTQFSNPQTLIILRFIHGTIGGLSVGIGLSIIARTYNPDKIFGMLLVVQYSFGSLGIWLVPRLVDSFGYSAAFGTLISFTLMTLLILPFVPNVESPSKSDNTTSGLFQIPMTMMLFFVLCALFLFQAANMGVADYAFELGKDIGLSNIEISNILTLANIISISGGLLVYIIGTRFGRTIPLIIGISVASIFTYLLHYSDNTNIYFIANTFTGIAWGFTIPYLLGLCATFDFHGQMAALAGFVSKMGLASGPLVGSLFIISNGFSYIINLATIALLIALILSVYVSKNHEKS
ncbi:MAG: MFS transporter [SAR86 cluster bacterium]|jgi:predicted MFS family arabinose efflux permease|nr:MFS transporter [SAR86 cluster bacterium]|tara:strand:+ start:1151 stop:2317 length:1167 start_codon:yes stop_codon:yes gene_type:complete